MGRYVLKRVGELLLTLFIIMTLLFFLFRIMPGDPAAMVLDPKMPPEAKALIRHQFGLDKPLAAQYLIYLKNTLRGEMGRSFYYPETVRELILSRLPNTVGLFTFAILLSYLIGIPLGKRLAWRRGSRFEISLTAAGLFFYTIFIPWFGLLLLWIFSYRLGWFPLGGMVTPQLWAGGNLSMLARTRDIAYHLVLPLGVLVLAFFAGAMLLMRNSMLATLREDYIITARAKGLPEKTIRDRHAGRNAMLPVVTAIALSVAFSVNGGVLTEKVFSWPGLGTLLIQAVLSHDYPLAQGAFLLIAGLVLLANLAADIIYSFLDPRVRYE